MGGRSDASELVPFTPSQIDPKVRYHRVVDWLQCIFPRQLSGLFIQDLLYPCRGFEMASTSASERFKVRQRCH